MLNRFYYYTHIINFSASSAQGNPFYKCSTQKIISDIKRIVVSTYCTSSDIKEVPRFQNYHSKYLNFGKHQLGFLPVMWFFKENNKLSFNRTATQHSRYKGIFRFIYVLYFSNLMYIALNPCKLVNYRRESILNLRGMDLPWKKIIKFGLMILNWIYFSRLISEIQLSTKDDRIWL